MKKKLASALLIVSIIVLIANLMSGKGKLYSELCITYEQEQEIIEGRRVSATPLFTKILFNGYELVNDTLSNCLFYSLIENDSNAYNPNVKCISEKGNLSIAIVGNVLTDEGIASGEEHTLLIYSDKEYQYVSLVCTTLPLLSINHKEEIGDYDPVLFEMELFDNRKGATQRITAADGEIRIRGRYSRNYPKKGYRITLYETSVGENRRERKNSLLGMRQDGDWILYAAYNDLDKVRNVFSSNLWMESCGKNNVFGLSNGMEYRYVELFVNNQYWGLYALGYPIDSLQLQMKTGEYMYSKMDPYLSELDIDYAAEGAVPGYQVDELGVNLEESWDPLKRYYTAMLRGEDENYGELREMVDMGNSIDIFLFLNMIQGIDHANLRGSNIIHNIYMTNKINTEDMSEIMLYTPWDMDRTWGYGFGFEGYSVSPDQNVLMQTNIVYLLLEQGDEEMKQMLVQRYTELRESFWSNGYLLQTLASYEKQIFDSGAYERDRSRWPEGVYNDGAGNLDTFKMYVLDRMQYMDQFIEQYE